MNKNIQIYGLLLGLTFCIGCEKEPFDYRNKYVGDWDFKVINTHFNMGSGTGDGMVSKDSSIIRVEMKYGRDDDALRLVFPDYNFITIHVDREGELYKFSGNYKSGEFIGNDSLNLHFRSGGLGGGSTNDYYGKKITIGRKYF